MPSVSNPKAKEVIRERVKMKERPKRWNLISDSLKADVSTE